ncbi:right-handed parallel beta-helix repeat-containing protein [bacterium]|nr:right-handed parallel beta-helix repeat-containing protein [bacterium]
MQKSEVPALQFPADGQASSYAFPNFWWTEHPAQFADPGAPVTYEIQIARDTSFDSIVDEDSVGLPRYVHDRPFASGTYHWRVRSVTFEGQISDWSSSFSFTIAEPDEVVTVDFDPSQKDPSPGVRDAVDRVQALAKEGKSVRLVFPAGDYRFPETFSGRLIDLPGVRNVSVEGEGATLHFTTRKQALLGSEGSENVSISGFEVLYAKGSLRIQGRVKAVDPKSRRAVLAIEPGYPDFSASDSITNDIFILLDPKVDGRLKDRCSNFYRMDKDYSKNPDGTWTVTIPGGDFSDWEPGDRFVFHFRGGSPVLINYARSRSVTAYGLNIGGWGNMGFVSVDGAEFSILSCKTFIPEGKWMMGNADGVHIRGHEIGPWIEGTEIQAIGDDGVALYARPASMVAAKPNGEQNAAVCRDEHFNLEPGDAVSFFQPLEGTIPLETTVKTVQSRPDGTHLVHFADPLPDGIRVDGPLVDVTQIWNRSKSCGDFVVRNCKFTNIRRYGTVFRAKRGIVENCEYRGVSSRAILFRNEPNYPNGLYASQIIIRHNTIEDSGFDGNATAPTITFRFEARNTHTRSIGPRNILIEDNTIVDSPSPSIELVGAGNVVIRNNRQLAESGEFRPVRYTASQTEDVRFSE